MSGALEELAAAAPWPERMGLRVMLALGSRPRGRAILRRVPLAAQAASSSLALGHYDDPDVARPLGFDAQAVVARGRELRRAEGRP